MIVHMNVHKNIGVKNISVNINVHINVHMGSFPQPQHFFAAAQENKDFGALHRGPSMP